jgi:methionyl-tRNA formyltransferase
MAKPRAVVFAYHNVGYECLEALLAHGADVVAVFTHADTPGENIWFKSVSALARQHHIPVHTPSDVNTAEWMVCLRALKPDILFSFYYRHMISEAILALAPLGAYNMHGSLLPKYRGRVPINWAVLHGETETGATLHVMVKRADAGDIVDQERVAIGPTETARQVFEKVTVAARTVLERQLDALFAGRAPRHPQDDTRASYFGGRRAEDGRIDWRQSAQQIFNLIRAVTHPYPGAFTQFENRHLYIWWARALPDAGGAAGQVISTAPLRIATGQGCLDVLEWQWQGDPQSRRGDDHGIPNGAVLDAVDRRYKYGA